MKSYVDTLIEAYGLTEKNAVKVRELEAELMSIATLNLTPRERERAIHGNLSVYARCLRGQRA
jgi:hypothetical protein